MLRGDISNRQAPIIAIDISDILIEKPQSFLKRIFGATMTYELDKLKVALINQLWDKYDYCIYLVKRWDLNLSEDEVTELLGNKVNYTRIDSLGSMHELNNKCRLNYKYFFFDIKSNEIPLMGNVYPFKDIRNLL